MLLSVLFAWPFILSIESLYPHLHKRHIFGGGKEQEDVSLRGGRVHYTITYRRDVVKGKEEGS